MAAAIESIYIYIRRPSLNSPTVYTHTRSRSSEPKSRGVFYLSRPVVSTSSSLPLYLYTYKKLACLCFKSQPKKKTVVVVRGYDPGLHLLSLKGGRAQKKAARKRGEYFNRYRRGASSLRERERPGGVWAKNRENCVCVQ